MKRKNDFKIREYHVMSAPKDGDDFGLCGYLWQKLKTFNSLSEAVKYARWYKEIDTNGDYRVLGEFDYEEI